MSNQGDGTPEGNGGRQGNTGGQWTDGQQPWAASGQPPSWSAEETGPNVGPTMNNPQSSYYDRFSEASGEGVVVPPKGGGGGRGKVLVGVAAALVVLIAAVAVVALTRGGGTPKQAATSASSSLPPLKPTTWVNPTLAAGTRPLKEGWQSQPGHGVFGVYDVPGTDDWEVESDSMTRFYEDPNGNIIAGMAATSTYGVGFCKSDKDLWKAVVGMRGGGTSDPTDLGAREALKFADGIVTSAHGTRGKKGKLSAPEQIKVNEGTIPAVQYTITATDGDPVKCDKGKKYEIRTVTFSLHGKTYQFVILRLLGIPGALPDSTLDEIITTFRTRA